MDKKEENVQNCIKVENYVIYDNIRIIKEMYRYFVSVGNEHLGIDYEEIFIKEV